ncbi:hypothetical protein GCM10009754_00480 [Amycolatopsis minnesotensis]|uniref:Uncharacterized protein n=2 Tax=Amycolatopsis minnesotensis TaxID=337894 RepID=A0ABP5BAW0_9PSEU
MIASNTTAATALLFSLATQRRENRRDRERLADKRKQQASRVFASISTRPSGVHDNYLQQDWVVINHSNQPIYDVTASTSEANKATSLNSTAAWDKIAPGTIARHSIGHARSGENLHVPAPAIDFLDCTGRRWKRHPNGMLQQATVTYQADDAGWGPLEEPLTDLNHPDWVRDSVGRWSTQPRDPRGYWRPLPNRAKVIGTTLATLLVILAVTIALIIMNLS